MIEPGTGYILLSDFARSTSDEMARAIAKLKAQGMKRLLVDLRNNGGGLLDQAIDVADQFLPKGSRIVETRGRTRDSFQTFDAAGEHPDLDLPVVVLVNGGTASAAEILSGAIQDHDIGMIVGVPDLGQGPGPDGLRAFLRRRPGADHRQVLHALGPPHPARLQLLLRLLLRASGGRFDARTADRPEQRIRHRSGPQGLWRRRHHPRRPGPGHRTAGLHSIPAGAQRVLRLRG